MCAAFSPLQTCPAKKDSLFHRGHPGLQCAALAGPDGSVFSFLPALCPFCLNFHQREARCFSVEKDGYFVSEGFSRQLPLATAAHNRLTRLQQGRSGASLVSFPYLSSIPHTGPHRGVFGFAVFFSQPFSVVALPAGAPGGNSPLHEWAKSCKVASHFSQFPPMSIR